MGKKHVWVGVAAVPLLVGLTACGGAATGGNAAEGNGTVTVAGVEISKDEKLAEMVPEEFRSGVKALTIAPYPPYMEIGPGGEVEGALIDVGDAVAAKLGVTIDYSPVNLDGAIPALQAGKGDLLVMTLADTAEREKVLDFINFGKDGLSLMVKAGNPEGIESGKDLCGKNVTILSGWSPADTFDVISEQCESEGRQAVNILRLPKTEDGLMAVKSGNASASYVSKSAALTAVKELGENAGIEVILPKDEPAGWNHQYKGLTLPKGSELEAPIEEAMRHLLEDGTLKQIFDEYEVGYILNDEIIVNEALALSNLW
ncbi:transporter substrate-binding domain-containing protein [Arthrobacter sp. USHLN218]|uniref:transporter substrate-binding domain-containing protein n=1 Tax=Arthrobacter sp. USHLN218 TaxID=3081232 RepID=UPI00301A43EA